MDDSDEESSSTRAAIGRLAALVDRLRPSTPGDAAGAEANLGREVERLRARPADGATLGADVALLLSQPLQGSFYAETGVRSALGFWLELERRFAERLLPSAPRPTRLGDVVSLVFTDPADHEWVCAVGSDAWVSLARALGLPGTLDWGAAIACLVEAARMLSYRLAGNGLDRELLRADPALERYESPFVAQNAALIPAIERARNAGQSLDADDVRHVDVLLDQCVDAIGRTRRRAGDAGTSIRLTYLLARQSDLVERLRLLLDHAVADDRLERSVALMKSLVRATQTRLHLARFVGENVSLLARNVTDNASRHGEHYIAEDSAQWRAMGRSAAGGGLVIALMALAKIGFSGLHLPPLTEGVVFGLNYGIGFVVIHLLGFTVATKQPAMTASSIAATLEEARPADLERLGDFAQDVARTQFVAVAGNVCVALPLACAIAAAWPVLFGSAVVSPEKAARMLEELYPLESGALWYAAVAGIGLFLSGLVSGLHDNQARYRDLASRVAAAPWLAWLGRDRTSRLGRYLDEHYGAIMGNLFFGAYLGLVGVAGTLTGLPVDIRHVAFSSANLGTSAVVLGAGAALPSLAWAAAGVLGIAVVNLVVSFALALYVAMKSRRVDTAQIPRLAKLLATRFLKRPHAFFFMSDRR